MASEKTLRLYVQGLFSQYNYCVEVKDSGCPVILTGPNGYGKTTILNILRNFKNKNFLYFLTIPFDKIDVSINNTLIVSIVSYESDNTDDEDESVNERILKFSCPGENSPFEISISSLREIYRKIPSVYYWVRRIQEEQGEVDNRKFIEILQKNSEELLNHPMLAKHSFLSFAFASFPDVSFVQANRLTESMPGINQDRESDNRQEEIEKVSSDLKNQLKVSYDHFLAQSQKSDKDFVRSILQRKDEISEEEYKFKSEKIKLIFEELSKYELADKIEMPDYDKVKSFILKAYLEDLDNNLELYQSILGKLRLFKGLVDAKRLAGKEMKIDKTNGLRMISTKDSSFISLNCLSSGEKNQLILLYDLLFRVADNSILLIDEPELSLHVAWQLDFLDDLTKIAKMKKLMVIVATHSPQIIGERWEDCYDLYEVASSQNVNI